VQVPNLELTHKKRITVQCTNLYHVVSKSAKIMMPLTQKHIKGEGLLAVSKTITE
jgi:hypothetical protein